MGMLVQHQLSHFQQTDMGYIIFLEMCGSGVQTGLVQTFIIVEVVKTLKGQKQATCGLCVVVPIYVINLIVIAIVWLHELRIRQIVQLGILDFAALLMSKKTISGITEKFY